MPTLTSHDDRTLDGEPSFTPGARENTSTGRQSPTLVEENDTPDVHELSPTPTAIVDQVKGTEPFVPTNLPRISQEPQDPSNQALTDPTLQPMADAADASKYNNPNLGPERLALAQRKGGLDVGVAEVDLKFEPFF